MRVLGGTSWRLGFGRKLELFGRSVLESTAGSPQEVVNGVKALYEVSLWKFTDNEIILEVL